MSSKLYFRTHSEHWEPLPDDLYTQCALLCDNCAAGWIVEKGPYTDTYYHLTPDEIILDDCEAESLIRRYVERIK